MSGAGEHILLIDDDPDMHHVITLILEPRGYQVSSERTGPAGLEAVWRQPPNLILLDIMLASPSEGLELAAMLKDDPRSERIPIIMISAIGRQVGADLARQMGVDSVSADRFLEKPLEAETLLAAVREVLGTGT